MTMLPYSLGSSLASMPSELSSSLRHLLNLDAIGLSSCLAHRVLSTAQSRHRQPKVHHLRRPRPVVDRLRYGRSIVSAAISPGTDDTPGLMMLLSDTSPRSTQIAFPLIAGVGLGMLFHAPYQVFTRALRRQEVASGTSAFFLVRFTGATVGLVRPFFPPARALRGTSPVAHACARRNPRHTGRRGRRVSGPALGNAPCWRRPVRDSRIT